MGTTTSTSTAVFSLRYHPTAGRTPGDKKSNYLVLILLNAPGQIIDYHFMMY